MREVLNVEQASELLGVSPWTVRYEASHGRLPGRKIGREWRFSRTAILDYLSSGRSEYAVAYESERTPVASARR